MGTVRMRPPGDPLDRPRSAGRPRSRRLAGLGTLALVLLIILVIAVIQAAQHILTGQVTDQARRSSLGRGAVTLARSMIHEANLMIQESANDEGHDLHGRLRDEVLRAGSRVYMTYPASACPETGRLMATDFDGAFQLQPVIASFSGPEEIAGLIAPEYEGIMTLGTTVRSSVHPGVQRSAEESWGYRVVHVALPPPLGRYSMMIEDPRHVLAEREDLNEWTEFFRDELPRMRDVIREKLAEFDRSIAKLQGRPLGRSGRQTLENLRIIRGYYARLIEDDAGIARAARTGNRIPRRPPYPPADEADRFILVARSDTIELEAVDVQRHLEQEIETFRRLRQEYQRLVPEVESRYLFPEPHERLTDKIEELARQIDVVLGHVVVFTGHFEPIRFGEAGFADHRRAFHRVDPGKLARLRSPAFLRASYHVLEADPAVAGQESVTTRLMRLFDRLSRGGTGLSGVIRVVNRSETLELRGLSLPGRWTLVVEGPVEIQDLTRARPEDVHTIIADGRPASGTGGVSLAGRIEASLVVTGRKLRIAPGTQIDGALILNDLVEDSIGGLSGQIVRDRRLESSGDARFLHVSFSPWIRSTRSSRSDSL